MASARCAEVAREKRTRTPAPAATTCPATMGWSSRIGATTSGTPCHSDSHTVLWPAWQTTASTRGSRSSWGTCRRTRTLSGTSLSEESGSTSTARTGRRDNACAAWARNRWPASALAVPRVTSTVGVPSTIHSHGKSDVDGRGRTDGPTSHTSSCGSSTGPSSSRVVNASTPCGENRGSGPPEPPRSPSIRSASHVFTFGMPDKGSTSSADVVAEVTHGSPSSSATSPPATACWSATTTSGANSATAARTPGAIARASGSRKSCHRKRNAAGPVRSEPRAASSGDAQSSTAASSPTSLRTTSW